MIDWWWLPILFYSGVAFGIWLVDTCRSWASLSQDGND